MRTVKVKVKNAQKTMHRLDKKVAGVFLGATILVLVAGFVGILSANAVVAKGKQRPVKELTQFDRILYWKGATRCTSDTQNMSVVPDDSLPECYNPIPQEYGLGYINKTANVGRALRRSKSSGQAVFYTTKQKLGDNGRSLLRFVDFFNGASYMGELYDVRVYVWREGGGAGNVHLGIGDDLISNWHNCETTGDGDDAETKCNSTNVITEWHFYPRNTLKILDNLYYNSSTKNIIYLPDGSGGKCGESNSNSATCWDDRSQYKENGVTYYYDYRRDENLYRDTNGKGIYGGAYHQDSLYGPVVYTAKTMEEHLRNMESSVQLSGVNGTGFRGTVAFKDIDTHKNERYTPASGVGSVFTTRASIEYAKLKDGGDSNIISNYSWGGHKESSPTNKESWLWFSFSSTNSTPFTLKYSGTGHGSDIESSTFTIAHVIQDDLESIPTEILEAMEKFRSDYKAIYGKELNEDEFFNSSEGADVDPGRVIRLFRIYQYSEYNPYTINELLEEFFKKLDPSGKTSYKDKLEWYSCEEMMDNCGIKPNEKDFISKNKVYYASIDSFLEKNFDNTCYSGNNNPVEVKQE